MTETLKTDICVIGGGSGGLSVAAGTSQMGAPTVLIEQARMGGDCLNYGCVPSKSLLASAAAANSMRTAEAYGLDAVRPTVHRDRVRDHIRDVIAGIAPHDSVERFQGLGVTVVQAAARFIDPATVEADDIRIKARRFVIATGSTALVPPIPGLDSVPYFTNETIFENAEPIDHLVIIGGGPIGMEMAQAHRRLGSAVTVVEMAEALGKDDPEIAAVALDRLRGEGIRIEDQASVKQVSRSAAGGVCIEAARGDAAFTIEGSHLLVAAGRKPVTDGLALEAADVAYTDQGITVDAGLRTSNKKIFAIGDVAGPFQFTHMANYQAGVIVRRALFRLPAKADYRAVPWVTFTDPEVAHVGMTEAAAAEAGIKSKILRFPFADIDRARTDRQTDGLAKIVLDRRQRVIGASLVGRHAGELLQPWCLMVAERLKISAMANLIAPYPTMGEVNKRVAGSYYTPLLFSARTRRLVRFLRWFG